MTDQLLTAEQKAVAKAEAKRVKAEAKARAKEEKARAKAQATGQAPILGVGPEVVIPAQPVGITMEQRAAKRAAEFAERSKDWETRPLADITRTLWEKEGNIFILEEVSLGDFHTRLVKRAG